MATNENEIGVRARFIMEDFDRHVQQYNAKLAQANQATDTFYQEQTATQQKAVTASKAASEQQTKSINQVVTGFRRAAFVLTGIVVGLVVTYKKLNEAAKELGDSAAVAEFDAINASASAFEDTLLASELELLKVSDALSIVAGVFETLRQSVAIATGGLVYLLELMKGIEQSGFQIGIKGVGSIGIGGGGAKQSIQEIAAAAKAAADAAFLNIAQAPERSLATSQAADREKEAQKAREKNSQQLADYISKIRDLQIKSGESLLDAEKDYQDKSASSWQDYISKVSDIVAEGVKKRAELTRTYNDTIAKAEQDYQRGAEDAAYNHGKALADIERDYQDTIRNVQQTYEEDALDAVRNLDAIGLIRARERRDKDLANAAQTRDRANAAENENYGRQLAELQRALEDKKREAEDAYQRGLEDQRKAEQEATQEAKDALNKQNAEAKAAYDQRLVDINQSYANERAAAQAQYLNQENALRAHLEAMRAIMAQYGLDVGGGGTSPVVGGGTRRRAEGGIDVVSSPTNFVAGEGGSPELVITAPLNRSLPSPITQTVNHVGNFDHEISGMIQSNIAGLDGRIIASIRKALYEIIR